MSLLLLGAIWGASYLFLRIAVPHFGPVPLVEIRLLLGALMLLPFLLFAWAAQRAPAGVGAIANGMTALWAALVGFLFFQERLTTRQSIALCAGFAGIVVLASTRIAGMSVGWASFAGALASLMYGVGIHMARRYLSGLPSAALAACTLGCSALVAAPFALATWPAGPVPPLAWLSAAALGVLCTGIGFVMYYRLIERIGANRTSTVTYLIPPFGVAWGWLFLGERATATMLIACALILGSVALMQLRPRS